MKHCFSNLVLPLKGYLALLYSFNNPKYSSCLRKHVISFLTVFCLSRLLSLSVEVFSLSNLLYLIFYEFLMNLEQLLKKQQSLNNLRDIYSHCFHQNLIFLKYRMQIECLYN